ncbi:MAG: PilZ domain-containing protein [Planctomycetia bacterium]
MSDSTPQPPRDAQADLQLQAMFDGKRASERFPCHVTALLDGTRGSAPCTLADISTGGALLRIDDPAFVRADAAGGPAAYYALLQEHAARGLLLSIPHRRLRVPCEAVRFIAGFAGGEAARVGVRFLAPLAPSEVANLCSGASLVPDQPPAPAARAPLPPAPTQVPAAGARLGGLVFHAAHAAWGPLAAGTLTGFDAQHALLRLPPGSDAARIAQRMANGPLTLCALESGRVLHESTVVLAALAPSADGSLTLTLASAAAWAPALAARLGSAA